MMPGEEREARRLEEAVARGMPVDALNADGWTALMVAARRGHSRVAASLLRLGADVNATEAGGSGLTAAMIAARSGHLGTLGVLVGQAGCAADVPARTVGGVDLFGMCKAALRDDARRQVEAARRVFAYRRRRVLRAALDAWVCADVVGVVEAYLEQ